MPLRCGIVGLPNVGKSTLFNAIARTRVPCENYPFCTIDPNVGVVAVPDPRLAFLGALVRPQRTVAATFEFLDIAGLVSGASRGEGLGNQFLSHIRDVDAIAHVVRCFEDPNVTHVTGLVDPVGDLEIVELELLLADRETVERRLEKLAPRIKARDPASLREQELAVRLRDSLDRGIPVRRIPLEPAEREWLREYRLLSAKPVLLVANLPEEDIGDPAGNPLFLSARSAAAERECPLVPVAARIEDEIAQLEPLDRSAFLEEMGIAAPGLDRIVGSVYDLLSLITFFTAEKTEARAWPVKRGTRAAQAAGRIHTDFERTFIRAEVTSVSDLEEYGSETAVRENGRLRLEGRDYVVRDGDVIHFRCGA